MNRLLFLAHRIPFPPNKGDKIRSYHILKFLSERYEVHLATLVDDRNDLEHIRQLSGVVKGLVCDIIRPVPKKFVSALELFRGRPISVSYFYSRKIQQAVDSLLRQLEFEVIFCSSSPMAEYLFRSSNFKGRFACSKAPCAAHHAPCLIMDLIDVDSQKWRDYAARSSLPKSWIYTREAALLAAYEKKICEQFEHVLLVSEPEKKILSVTAPARNVAVMPNGVDLDYFSPEFKAVPPRKGPVIIFTGAMDYWPNVEGVEWFAKRVFPIIRNKIPNVTFYVVGSRPVPAVRRLAVREGVQVTGYVQDIRPHIAAADVCVVPLRIARGIQNKVLEAFAMGKAVVCTPQALEGIEARPGADVIVARDESSFAESVLRLIESRDGRNQLGKKARLCVEKNYSWDKNLSLLGHTIEASIGRSSKDIDGRKIARS
jgi:sugar transferase (PEP-CTERM/EpsH1 system associated)